MGSQVLQRLKEEKDAAARQTIQLKQELVIMKHFFPCINAYSKF